MVRNPRHSIQRAAELAGLIETCIATVRHKRDRRLDHLGDWKLSIGNFHLRLTRHTPRPCVNANNCFCPAGVRISDSHIVTAGPNPVSSLIHVLPPSIDTITPRSVPRYSRCRSSGSTTIECTGMSGRPSRPEPSRLCHVSPLSVLRKTCAPPKFPYVA